MADGSRIEQYEHHGTIVSVRSDLRGRHWDHCLCGSCALFNPGDRAANCGIANELYEFCARNGTVTPVWECPRYQQTEASDASH